MKNIRQKFIKCINEECHDKYFYYNSIMESYYRFSPIDYEHTVIKDVPYQTFEKILINTYNGQKYYDIYSRYKNDYGSYKSFDLEFKNHEFHAIFDCGYRDSCYGLKDLYFVDVTEGTSFQKIYNELKPIYGIYYLKNGKEYKACYKDQFAWILHVLYGVCT